MGLMVLKQLNHTEETEYAGGGTWDHGGLWERAVPRAVNKLGFKILIFLACNWSPEHQAGKNPFPSLLTPAN